MNQYLFLLGILPLVAFVIVDTFAGLKSGLIVACVVALAEAVLSLVLFGSIDWITGLSFALIAIMSALSYYTNSDLYFKFQPVFIGVILGGALVVSYLMGTPLLSSLLTKYKDQIAPLLESNAVPFEALVHFSFYATLHMGVAMLFHAALVAFAALKLNKWWWLIFRGVGFYLFLFLASITTRLQLS